MKLSELQAVLKKVYKIGFELPNGKLLPSHFYWSKVSLKKEHQMLPNGSIRKHEVIEIHLTASSQNNHRRNPSDLQAFLNKAKQGLDLPDLSIEVALLDHGTTWFTLQSGDPYFKLIALDNTSVLTILPLRISKLHL
ncbi:hypothetical protein LDL79_15740 [Leeuwenhoekiella palythoae]|uniref:DUF6428 family protein n=1 Tax=Leeuwenhoekiella palythoae TaxID=573501 RepID=UPI001CE151F4|nr:hypothetical protein [Leeuwenhoekiella palythoae]UBZ10237.1 hypothetical protein LDL79_15740 [Leeuwenhoekiella palythoae]